MRIKTLTILFYITSLLGCLYADLGYTSEQATAKFGKPSGFLNNGASIICIYDTVHGRITEVYNAYDICIESDATRVLPQDLQGPPVEEVPVVEEELDTVEEDPEIEEEEPVVQEEAPVQALATARTVRPFSPPPVQSKPASAAQENNGLEKDPSGRKINIFQLKIVLLFALSLICILLALVMRTEQQEAKQRRVAKKLESLRNAKEQDEKSTPVRIRDAEALSKTKSDSENKK